MSKKNKKTMHEKVMQKIKKEHIKMHPRIYFLAGSALLGLGLALILITSSFFANITMFHIRTTGSLQPIMLIRHLTNWPALLSLLAVVIGVKLIRKYEVTSRYNIWGILISTLAFVLTLGFLINHTTINTRLQHKRHIQRLYQQKQTPRNKSKPSRVLIPDGR